jgi:hypothetical protein
LVTRCDRQAGSFSKISRTFPAGAGGTPWPVAGHGYGVIVGVSSLPGTP